MVRITTHRRLDSDDRERLVDDVERHSEMATKSFIIRRKVRSTSSEFAFTFRRNQRSTSVGVHTAREVSLFLAGYSRRGLQRGAS
jgi:hypothetical protein